MVGRECFEIKGTKCVISIDAVGIFSYEYSLQVGGKTYEKFREQQKKALQTWQIKLGGGEETFRVCLEKDSMDIWVNARKVNTTVGTLGVT